MHSLLEDGCDSTAEPVCHRITVILLQKDEVCCIDAYSLSLSGEYSGLLHGLIDFCIDRPDWPSVGLAKSNQIKSISNFYNGLSSCCQC